MWGGGTDVDHRSLEKTGKLGSQSKCDDAVFKGNAASNIKDKAREKKRRENVFKNIAKICFFACVTSRTPCFCLHMILNREKSYKKKAQNLTQTQ